MCDYTAPLRSIPSSYTPQKRAKTHCYCRRSTVDLPYGQKLCHCPQCPTTFWLILPLAGLQRITGVGWQAHVKSGGYQTDGKQTRGKYLDLRSVSRTKQTCLVWRETDQCGGKSMRSESFRTQEAKLGFMQYPRAPSLKPLP